MSLLKVKQISQWNEERYLIYTIYKIYIRVDFYKNKMLNFTKRKKEDRWRIWLFQGEIYV